MATVTATLLPSQTLALSRVKWAALGGSDVGSAVGMADYQDRTVQVLGTFGSGTVVIQGSNDDGTTWATLTDPLGNALSFTSAGMKQITELPQYIRPSVTGGTNSAIDVYLHMRGRDQ
jgi:hypothetical protein